MICNLKTNTILYILEVPVYLMKKALVSGSFGFVVFNLSLNYRENIAGYIPEFRAISIGIAATFSLTDGCHHGIPSIVDEMGIHVSTIATCTACRKALYCHTYYRPCCFMSSKKCDKIKCLGHACHRTMLEFLVATLQRYLVLGGVDSQSIKIESTCWPSTSSTIRRLTRSVA